jgi:Fur family transcriptional regulator, zinc uptake regulator
MAGRPQSMSKVAKSTRTSTPKVKADLAVPIDIEALCRERGGRLTKQRRSVLCVLTDAKRPLTAYELLGLTKPSDRSATPASIYRSLDFLLRVGLAHRLETTRSYVACGHPGQLHFVQFLICRTCGTVIEAKDKWIVRATDNLGKRHGFALDQRTVELTGICATCKHVHPEGCGL